MAKKFVTDREVSLIDLVNKELLQDVVQEYVYYYAISADASRTHSLYREAIQKTWAAPVQVNALVRYDNPTVKTTGQGSDSEFTLEVYLHTQELLDRNLVPKDGDFVEYGSQYYEISGVTRPQLVFGQVNNKILTKLVCVKSRSGQFRPQPHPVSNSSGTTLNSSGSMDLAVNPLSWVG